ncbi:hypothetical protein PHISCL_06766 [Aspergillus sclerotialis]|uniref:DNA (cytosine-5)-methyltransferase 1 replication foci domain-containing protein n=1 Tax=Aspergillus sclerotialis TaxID=2070753 RepID=A0A3A2ZCP0_9EURO|nr:hypothetical protein PHISCL_06766 [Aspergillus sclerotialis]
MTSREDSVLAERDPSLDDENDWEEFSLIEARVLIPGKSRYANLLSASPDNPVQVTGCLDEVEEEQESLVLDEDYLNKRIVIENVTHYAYGQHDDGEIGVWVAGRAGWFSISPAKGYKNMFNDTVEAIDLLYFLADRHQRKRRRQKAWNPSVEYLLEEYVIHTHGICEDAEDSAEVFYKHRDFLFPRMIKGEEGVDWSKTNLFAHLCEKFPEDYERIKSILNPESQSETDPDEYEGEGEGTEAGSKADSGEKEVNGELSQPKDQDSVSKSQADIIYKVIVDLKDAGHLAKRQLNLDLVASNLVSRFEIDTEEYARDLISARAGAILELMNEAKTASFDWSRRAIYKELKSASKKNDVQDIAITPLRPRSDNNESSEDSDSEEQPRPRRRRVRKSVLRPKSSVSAKLIGKRTRNAAADEEDLSDENGNGDEYETPSKVRGHELVREPLSTRVKRTRSILSDSGSTPVQKTPLQETLQSRNTSVSAMEQDVPDMDPVQLDNLPNDTWVCQARGCEKVIYKCSTKRGKELVQDHSLAHANDTQAKLDLVFSEQRLNINIPVDNLLSRIRELGTVDPELANMANGTSSIAG